MNAELITIRDSLRCGHCSSIFRGSDSQAWKVKYEKRTVYCSSICRSAATRNRLSKPIPNRGACPVCNQTFYSRTAKIYCSLDCYVASPQFAKVTEAARNASRSLESRSKMAESLRKGEDAQCLNCGSHFYRKKSTARRKFCTTSCYRSYLADRFDRWVADPQGMALPQCYDEFLDQEELRCVVSGCQWSGAHLTVHMNMAHGVRGDEFKRAAGFNLGTGVVARPLAEALQQRPLQGVALQTELPDDVLAKAHAALDKGRYLGHLYRSREASEHKMKARALLREQAGPVRTCRGCEQEFRQTSVLGRTLYCTVECRDRTYAEARRAKHPSRKRRGVDGRYIKA